MTKVATDWQDFKKKKPESQTILMTKYCSSVTKYFTDYVLCELSENIPAWVGGGALRDYFLYGYIKSGTDIDIFTNCQENFDVLRKDLSEFYDEKIETDFALTFFDKEDNEKVVQLIKIFEDDPKECISQFDFTACCAYVGRFPVDSGNLGRGKMDEKLNITSDAADEFYEDCYNKKLRIIRLNENHICTLQRIKNYIAKGFTISDSEKISLINNYLSGHFQLEELVDEYEGLRLA